MIGAGATVFAVMGYAISRQQPPDFDVELNSKLLSAILGEPEDEIVKAIEYLCAPDPRSRSEKNEGRRLIKVGSFAYHMVNGEEYHRMRNYEERKDYNRKKQAAYREKMKMADPHASAKLQPEPTDIHKHPQTSTRFQKPDLLDLQSTGLSPSEAQKFINYYDSNGWKVGRNSMKDWKAAVRNWISRQGGSSNGNHPSQKSSQEMTEQEILREAMQ